MKILLIFLFIIIPLWSDSVNVCEPTNLHITLGDYFYNKGEIQYWVGFM